ncbi:MAG: FKBP-type peptidyl-prolyl cis-trans isomerase, partial [Myxococcales bacterium]|nr:FKBP-type peptidyl-prolyl cis-trans isomerase [Myxococcales bacterium]
MSLPRQICASPLLLLLLPLAACGPQPQPTRQTTTLSPEAEQAKVHGEAVRAALEPIHAAMPSAGAAVLQPCPALDGKALNSKTLASGVETHDYAMGEGEEVVEGKQVEFNFTGYASANARPVMGSRLKPAKLIINEATRTRDPIANAMADGMLGMKVGGKRKVKVPAAVVEEGAPPGRPAIGDIWMTVEVIGVEDPFIPQPAEAYAAAPVRTEKLDSGVQIYDIVAGEGPTAEDGYQVVAHYIGQLENGTEFDSSHSRAEGLSVTIGAGGVIQGFAEGLKGVRKGMLRKVVIPPEMGYGD